MIRKHLTSFRRSPVCQDHPLWSYPLHLHETDKATTSLTHSQSSIVGKPRPHLLLNPLLLLKTLPSKPVALDSVSWFLPKMNEPCLVVAKSRQQDNKNSVN